jgi:hypothetical protein
MTTHETVVRSVSDLAAAIASAAGVAIGVSNALGRRLPVTKLSEDVSKSLNVDKVLCYHIISNYIQTRGDLKVFYSPHGGIGPKETAV